MTRCSLCETASKRCKDCTRRANNIATAKWREKNPERIKALITAGDKANPLRKLAAAKKRQKAFPHLMVEAVARRRAAKYQAMPSWADRAAMKQYYLIAGYLSRELGVLFSVDHVVPLKSDFVCGLHAQTNMSILPAAWNAKKGNRSWPGMP